jgi:REP element-mobilizing transposase RayT
LEAKGKLPIRKTYNLYRGRRPIPGGRYFITLCSKDRRSGLTAPATAAAILATWRLQHAEGDYTFHCGTVMPDHIHCIFTLGDRLSLGKAVIKFKAKTKEELKLQGLSWQRDFYDHWLRAEKSMEGFARYIFLNPYRKALLAPDEAWPHWHLSHKYRPEFMAHLDDQGTPPAQWIQNATPKETLIDDDLHP